MVSEPTAASQNIMQQITQSLAAKARVIRIDDTIGDVTVHIQGKTCHFKTKVEREREREREETFDHKLCSPKVFDQFSQSVFA